ncbi:MAG: hypothetical protein U0559_09285 [Anaerolineae bacterium]
MIDQFEETFTQVAPEADRAAFLNLLTQAATAEDGRVSISLRCDRILCPTARLTRTSMRCSITSSGN